MSMTLRTLLALPLAALALAGCSESTAPVETVPRQLYFISCCDSKYPYTQSYVRLYGLALDGSEPVSVIPDSVLAAHPIYAGFPPWISRDGRQIKVQAEDSILSVDPLGRLLSVVPYPDSVPGSPGPALSPDGTTFAWFANGFLKLAKMDGGGLTRIYFDSLGPVMDHVAWSRDGGSVAYVSYFTSQVTGQPQDIRVWTRRFTDGLARPIVTLSAVPSSLAWSRDGRWLTIVSNTEIHRVRTDGTGSVQVVFSGGVDWPLSSSWGPRDSLLAIVTGNHLLVMHPDGTSARTVATGLWLWFASWRD